MSSFGRRRRGLSTIITGAMLLSATVVMGTGLVNWSNENLANYQKSISNTFTSNVNKLNENLVVENVWFGTSPSKFLNITITNTGTIGLNVTDIKLVNSTKVYDQIFSHSGIIPKQQNSTQISYAWKSKVPIQIIVTTLRGSIFTSQVMAP